MCCALSSCGTCGTSTCFKSAVPCRILFVEKRSEASCVWNKVLQLIFLEQISKQVFCYSPHLSIVQLLHLFNLFLYGTLWVVWLQIYCVHHLLTTIYIPQSLVEANMESEHASFVHPLTQPDPIQSYRPRGLDKWGLPTTLRTMLTFHPNRSHRSNVNQ